MLHGSGRIAKSVFVLNLSYYTLKTTIKYFRFSVWLPRSSIPSLMICLINIGSRLKLWTTALGPICCRGHPGKISTREQATQGRSCPIKHVLLQKYTCQLFVLKMTLMWKLQLHYLKIPVVGNYNIFSSVRGFRLVLCRKKNLSRKNNYSNQ